MSTVTTRKPRSKPARFVRLSIPPDAGNPAFIITILEGYKHDDYHVRPSLAAAAPRATPLAVSPAPPCAPPQAGAAPGPSAPSPPGRRGGPPATGPAGGGAGGKLP